jgi:aryl-alcohol dehydrogenase-like predicted oxidoreductase
MEKRTLGGMGPEISVVGFGAWEAGGSMWGPAQDDDQVVTAMEAGIQAGMNWIDTAEVYGRGRSEELVGQVLKRHPGEVLVFTKFGPRAPGRASRQEQLRRAAEGSIRRLGTDVVDLYQVHWPDAETVPLDETWAAMADLQDAGLVRHIGVSNFDREMVERCLAIRHVDSVQNQFSLLHQDDADDLLPFLEDRGVGYLAYGPLAFGLLTGAITRDTQFSEQDWRSGSWDVDYYEELFAGERLGGNIDRVDDLRAIAERLGTQVAPVALRAAVEFPGVTAAIAGTTNPDHVRSNAAAGDLGLDEETLRSIRSIFSGA